VDLVSAYQQQWKWRAWPALFDALPPLGGQTVLDVGCGVGDQTAELLRRGAGRVIGFDVMEEILAAARARALPNAEFRTQDLRAPLDALQADGLWSSFGAAYFPDLAAALAGWKPALRPGAWIALTEIDNLWGHEPLSARTKSLFARYASEGLDAWRTRLDWMRFLHDFCGPDFAELREADPRGRPVVGAGQAGEELVSGHPRPPPHAPSWWSSCPWARTGSCADAGRAQGLREGASHVEAAQALSAGSVSVSGRNSAM